MRSGKPEIRIVHDAEALAWAAAEVVSRHVDEALQNKRTFALVLSGGSTPKRLYTLMGTNPSLRARFPWDRIHFFWGDERHVPPDHPESNYRVANEAIFSNVPVPPMNIHRVLSENPDANEAARLYTQELSAHFHLEQGELPRFDCVLLGMGPDGHTASLFPGTLALGEKHRPVVANWIDKFQSFRITLTAPVLNHAKLIVFLVSGAEKAPALRDVLEGVETPGRLPAQLIRPIHGRILWIVDRAAASLLEALKKT